MEFIFVAIMCIGTKCDFMASDIAVPETHCIKMKEQFLTLPFKTEITLIIIKKLVKKRDFKLKSNIIFTAY